MMSEKMFTILFGLRAGAQDGIFVWQYHNMETLSTLLAHRKGIHRSLVVSLTKVTSLMSQMAALVASSNIFLYYVVPLSLYYLLEIKELTHEWVILLPEMSKRWIIY